MNKINVDALENVAGGKNVQVNNPSVPYANLLGMHYRRKSDQRWLCLV